MQHLERLAFWIFDSLVLSTFTRFLLSRGYQGYYAEKNKLIPKFVSIEVSDFNMTRRRVVCPNCGEPLNTLSDQEFEVLYLKPKEV